MNQGSWQPSTPDLSAVSGTGGNPPVDPGKREAVERAIRKGVIAGVVAGVVNLVVVAFAVLAGPTGDLSRWSEPWSFVDVALIFALTYGVHRRSRTAAVGLVILLVGSRILFWAETGNLAGLSLTIIFLYFFVRAAWGTFVHHRIRIRIGLPPAARRRWVLWVSIPFGFLFLVFLGIGVLVELGVIPDSAAVPGDRLSARNLQTLQAHDLVFPEENILYFYSDGLFSILEDGNFFTEDRVVSYERWEGELLYESADFEEIETLEADFGEGLLQNSTIRVATGNGKEFFLVVSPEGDGDKEFFLLMRKQWRKKREAGSETDPSSP